MKLFQLLYLVLIISLVGMVGCNQLTEKGPDVSHIQANVSIQDLEDELFASQSVQDVENFLAKYPFLTKVYFTEVPSSEASPDKSSLAAQLYENIRNNALRGFKQQIDSIFTPKAQPLQEQLESAFRHVKYYYPDFTVPKVATIVTGFTGNDLYVSDSLIIIGLDYFGGERALYRPQVYNYQLRRYQPESIVPSILFFLADRYNQIAPDDRTLLADMVGYGKSFEFVKHMAPQAPDSLIIGFSEENLTRTYNSQTELWAFFVENKLLYETSDLKKQKYVGERPLTPEIGPEVPGGIGRWIGWRIVSQYRSKNPDITLPELMKIADARKILQDSGYKGQIDDE
ncbi:gliding motility protein [Telluribacter sp. SYSU D00476]|uniref:gliding motility lipoprotein GldB n=1 Tax=Telluribacter sp. SYSU D00476 TaxID=2811430 RepID=UPI001FF1F080|nr:gliding motility protein [Telluribacter sp. SYSU D00476]